MGTRMSNGNGSVAVLDPMLESHEDRLQRVEGICNETRVAVAEIGERSDSNHKFLLEKVETNHEFMIERVENAFQRIDEKLTPLAATVAELKAQDVKDQAALRAIEVKGREAAVKSAKAKKALGTLAIGGGGVIVGKLAEMLWTWLSR